MTRLLTIFLLILAGCHSREVHPANKYTSIFQTADSIGISYIFEDRVSTIYKKDRKLLVDIADVFNNKETSCACPDTDGFITVYAKDTTVLDVSFAIKAGADSCTYFQVSENGKEKCYRLNYNIGMYLSEKRDFIKP